MPETARLVVRVIPRAKKSEFGGMRGEAVVVRLQAPPVEGAANEALRKFLAAELGVRPGDVAIVSGERSRDKVVRIEGLAQGELETRLRSALAAP